MILGLTGGIAAGKSTVSHYLANKGIPIVDCDKISRMVVTRGSEGARKIEEAFGSMFFVDGILDRQYLGQYCFADAERTKKLNEILHPLIEDEMEKQLIIHSGAPITVLDAPLLIEAGLHERCDKVMVVICAEKIRIERAIKRSNISKMETMKRIERQLPDAERRKYADFVINNNGALEKTLKQVDEIVEQLLKEA